MASTGPYSHSLFRGDRYRLEVLVGDNVQSVVSIAGSLAFRAWPADGSGTAQTLASSAPGLVASDSPVKKVDLDVLTTGLSAGRWQWELYSSYVGQEGVLAWGYLSLRERK